MITLGYVDKVNLSASTTIRVRIPLFEKSGISEQALFDASVCQEPGSMNGYVEGDCVVVGFMDNTMEKPLILGKLFTGGETSATNFSHANSLVVTEAAELPGNTTIGGVSVRGMITKLNAVEGVSQGGYAEEGQKSISIQVKQIWDEEINYPKPTLRIFLHNFSEDDVGSYVYLYRTTRGASQPKAYKHPANGRYGEGGVMGMGYLTVANKKTVAGTNPDVPSWMGKGLVCTEWELTADDISHKYFDVKIAYEWLSLLYYNHALGNWSQILGCSKYGCLNSNGKRHNGCLRMKFGWVKGGTLRFLSSDTLLFGPKAGNTANLYLQISKNDIFLDWDKLYMRVE